MKNAKEWMQTSEMDSLLSFLVQNEEYQDVVSVIPMRFILNFQRGVQAHAKWPNSGKSWSFKK